MSKVIIIVIASWGLIFLLHVILSYKRKPKYKRLELKLCSYAEADKLLTESKGKPENERWVLAQEEDENRMYGMCYLERKELIKK